MPFDPPPAPGIQAATRSRTRPVALWLFVMAGMILVMVALGGATRLTGSGLSIMEWAPIMGALPPWSDAEWHRLYALYRQIPQYDLVNQGFRLQGFKGIFWLEWTHRLWGRLMGVVFVVPLVLFAIRGRISRPLGLRLLGLLLLGGLQGLVGWVMVASGFQADSIAVSPYRLVAHLLLAVSLYAAILWTALGLWQGDARPMLATREPARSGPPLLRRMAALCCVLVATTIAAGGFVAGLHAGLTYNSFPFMDGRLVPTGYGLLSPFYRNWFENVAAVQFDHRLLATLTVIAVTLTALLGAIRARGPLRVAMLVLGAAVLLQYALGVATLLWAVPVALGAAHQTMAMLLLTAALVALHVAARPPPPALR